MSKKSETAEKIIFSGETESVVKWRKGNVRDFWIFIGILLIYFFLIWLYDAKDFIALLTFKEQKISVITMTAIIAGVIFYLSVFCIIQPLRITERGIYPPTRGILNIFLRRERFIPFSKIKEFRVYNPWIEKFPEEWARMSKKEREAKEILESDYDIILKNGKVIKMSSWTTAFYFSKNLSSVRKMREFRDILLKINKELKKGKTVIKKEEILRRE